RELDDNAAFQLALIENLLREDLNPVEETEGILQLLALKLGRNVEEIPPLLRRLQHERKEAANSSNNVIGKTELDSEQADNQVIVKDEDENFYAHNNVIGKDESEKLDAENNVIIQEELDSKETSNNVIGKDADDKESDSPPVNPD
ncbi:MAG: ParB/RepB/Spo0J family partition protein, partial [Nostoc sp.]